MNIKNMLYINKKKLQRQSKKALFLIIPVFLLVALSLVISSQVKNFKIAVDESVFATINEQARLIILSKPEIERTPGISRSQLMADTQLTENDLATVKNIEHVESASLNSAIPISNMKSSDLFEDEISFSNLTELDPNASKLFTEQDFEYKEDAPVPIIINANTFITKYEDWERKTEITIDFRSARERGEDVSTITPVKLKALDYNKDELIGKEFTIEFGGLDKINDYTTERDFGIITMKKLSEEEVEDLEKAREEALSKYWDIDKLNTPISKTFVIVGIIEDQDDTTNYIPTEFASAIMKEYIQHQLDARTSEEISLSLLNTTFTGLTYDGLELESSGNQSFGGAPSGGMGSIVGRNTPTDTYRIPGLVIELSDDGEDEPIGVYTNTGVYDEAVKYGENITILVDSVYSRQYVVDQLNKLGYAYQDVSKLEVFNTLQDSLEKITVGTIIGFIVLLSGVIIFAMSKFVSESRKEIGIFRAIGATKTDILKLFVTQSFLYISIGYFIGLGLGYVGNILASNFMSQWFDNLLSSTLEETYGVIIHADPAIFRQIDLDSMLIFSVILVVIAIVVSFIPAIKASNVSPVEAIKGE